MCNVLAVSFHSAKGSAGQISLELGIWALPVKEIHERTPDPLEHAGRVAGRSPEHPFYIFQDKVLVGILFVVLDFFVFGPWIAGLVRIDFDLLHVPALVHSLDAIHASVAGPNVNG